MLINSSIKPGTEVSNLGVSVSLTKSRMPASHVEWFCHSHGNGIDFFSNLVTNSWVSKGEVLVCLTETVKYYISEHSWWSKHFWILWRHIYIQLVAGVTPRRKKSCRNLKFFRVTPIILLNFNYRMFFYQSPWQR